MAYLGYDATVGEIKRLDSIAGSFNGSTTTFVLTSGGIAVSPALASQCIISVGGIIQEPYADYTVAGSTINFTVAPATGEPFFGSVIGRGVTIAQASAQASAVSFTPSGSIAANNVQAALVELDSDISTLTTTVSGKADSTNPTVSGTLTIVSGGISGPTTIDGVTAKIGYRNVPQNAQNGNYTLNVSDSGKHVYSVNTGAQTITIPTNAVQPIAIGDSISIINNGTTAITFSTAGTTVYKAGTSTAWADGGTLAIRGMATMIKVDTNVWFISGAGLS